METEMNARITRGLRWLAMLACAAGVLAVAASPASAREVVYSNIVSPLPGNYASIGYAATSTSEYGGEVEFAGTARKHGIVTVAMSAWACQEGSSSTNTCSTPKPKKKFKWPLTLSVYTVGAGNTVGSKLVSVTHTFGMPYRPSQSAICATEFGAPGAWYDEATKECFHGKAFTVSFHLGMKAPLPAQAIISLAYNTSNHGAAPVGAAPCGTTSAGCYYDSLNFATVEPAEKALTVGSDPTESQFVNSGYNEMYCGSSSSLNTFAPSGVCPAWYEGDQPAIAVQAG
jgi:hypothetical protein